MSQETRTRFPRIRTVVVAGLSLSLACAALPGKLAVASDASPGIRTVSAMQQQIEERQESLEQVMNDMHATLKANAKSVGQRAVEEAEEYIGVAYVYGGASPLGFDCSGLTMYVYAQQGITLTHNAQAQYNEISTHIAYADLKEGDLVFFGDDVFSVEHVGIYVGDGQYLHAPQTGDYVKISSLSDRSDYVGAARPC